MTPEEFSMFGTHTVPLLRFPKYVWEDGEIFNGDIEIVNYGEKSLQSEVLYQIEEEGKIVYSGKFPSNSIRKEKQPLLVNFNILSTVDHLGKN